MPRAVHRPVRSRYRGHRHRQPGHGRRGLGDDQAEGLPPRTGADHRARQLLRERHQQARRARPAAAGTWCRTDAAQLPGGQHARAGHQEAPQGRTPAGHRRLKAHPQFKQPSLSSSPPKSYPRRIRPPGVLCRCHIVTIYKKHPRGRGVFWHLFV